MRRTLCHMTAVQGEPRPANLEQGWTVDDSTFGARLALVRQRMQWNIKEAARECGIPAASWGTWENGAMPRRYTEMCRLIADRTGADLTWLVMGPSRTTGRASATGDLNDSSRRLIPSADGPSPSAPRPNVRSHRHVVAGASPYGGGRRDAARPVSAIPFSRRRPNAVRSGSRPITD